MALRQVTSKKAAREALVASIRTFWASCDTHLDWCVQRNPPGKDTRQFHIETTIEYLEAMLKAAKALK